MGTTDEPKKELTITRTFDAPVASVWRAWTDKNLVAKWWGPRGVTIPECELEPSVGGKFNLVMLAGKELGPAEGMRWPMRSTFKEVVPQRKLVFVGDAIDEKQDAMISSLITVNFEEEGGKTKLSIQIKVIKMVVSQQAEFALRGMEAGWIQQTEKLGEFLQRGQVA